MVHGKKDESCKKQDDVGSAKKARKRSKSVEKPGDQPSPLESKNKQRKLNQQQGEKSAEKIKSSKKDGRNNNAVIDKSKIHLVVKKEKYSPSRVRVQKGYHKRRLDVQQWMKTI